MGAPHMESNGENNFGAKQNNSKQKTEQHRKAKNTYGSGQSLQAMCLRAPFVADRPVHHAGDPVRGFFPGDLSVLSPGWVSATLVLTTGVHPVSNRLHQPFTEGQGHHGARQPLG